MIIGFIFGLSVIFENVIEKKKINSFSSHAGIVKRSPSSIVPGIWITVTFIHQTLCYLQMTMPVKKHAQEWKL